MSASTWSSTLIWIGHAAGKFACHWRADRKCYRTTWLWPGWYHNQSIWAHEMGHAFGLQHSSVGNGNGYGNMWDVMSVDGPCRTEPGYGRIGQHPIAYQKDILGWIPAERIFVAAPDSQATITLEQTAAPAPGNFLLARIPIRDRLVESARRMGDGKRPALLHR